MKKDYTIIIVLSVIIIVMVTFRKPIKKALSRGYRNNNPGNIRLTTDLWEGEIKGTDKDFKTFKSMPYGYRAMFITLHSYISKGFNTIEKIINRYAPSSENETGTYINTVANLTNTDPRTAISFFDIDKIKSIIGAMSYVENGIAPDTSQIDAGYDLYLA
jgi:hypothetical protein